jgi:DGQHR domain-containing protein
MKFFYADSFDAVDPNYDFLVNHPDPTRNRQHDDAFAHEILKQSPYHGILLSYATVGVGNSINRFSEGQRKRLFREGVREFYRFPHTGYNGDPLNYPIMGDSGSFSSRGAIPSITIDELVNFYQTCRFTHGVSLDSIVTQKKTKWDDTRRLPTEVDAKVVFTLEKAREFLSVHGKCKASFTPIGVIQAWSFKSAARNARKLFEMGYDYLGLGGVATRPVNEIIELVSEIRSVIPDYVRLHVFGITRFGSLKQLDGLGITTFDSSAPMIKAFKGQKNYFLPDGSCYPAVRLPTTRSATIVTEINSRGLDFESVELLEQKALDAFRSFKPGESNVETVLDALEVYTNRLGHTFPRETYERLLLDAPWLSCSCVICREIGSEVFLFNGLNRHKRRGFHNLHTLRCILDDLAKDSFLEYPCIRAEQSPGKNIYSFVVNGRDLFKFARISRIRRDDEGALLGYQRARVEDHVNDIHRYLEKDDALLPNSLVVAFDKRVIFKSKNKDGPVSFGKIRIPFDFENRPAWIVDGQQRATALNRVSRKTFPVSVVGFISTDVQSEREQFVLVNNVRPLPKSLIYELLPSLKNNVPIKYHKRQRACRLIERMNLDCDSPFFERIKTETNKHLPNANIKDLSVIKMVENSFENGVFSQYPKSEKEPLRILKNYWISVEQIFGEAWVLPPRKSRLTHGAGIISMGYLMDVIVGRLRADKKSVSIHLIKKELRKIGELPWCDGVWDLSENLQLPWDRIENTRADINTISNYIIRRYQNN